MLPVGRHPDGRIQRGPKYGHARPQKTRRRRPHHPQPAIHPSGARRATRYYLNHPLAPHLAQQPGPDPGPPPPGGRPTPSPPGTRGCVKSGSHGGVRTGPLEPHIRIPNRTTLYAMQILTALPWKISARDADSLEPALSAALKSGWTNETLAKHLWCNPNGVHYPVRLLARRLSELPEPPAPHPLAVPWCGECEARNHAPSQSPSRTGPRPLRFVRDAVARKPPRDTVDRKAVRGPGVIDETA